jgi:CTP synthase
VDLTRLCESASYNGFMPAQTPPKRPHTVASPSTQTVEIKTHAPAPIADVLNAAGISVAGWSGPETHGARGTGSLSQFAPDVEHQEHLERGRTENWSLGSECIHAAVDGRIDSPTSSPDADLYGVRDFISGVDMVTVDVASGRASGRAVAPMASADRPVGTDEGGEEHLTGAGRLIAKHGDKSTETEFHSPVPEGYVRGRTKFVAVFGTVMSGLGKGIFASSVAKLLKDKGLVVAPIKLEGYLNIDAGTLNPYRHGEVFVLDDGTECDMDLGTYERLLDQDLSRRNFMTSGQVFSTIIDRERQGAYLGRDVQWIPHVTGEVKRRLRELAMNGDGKKPADVVFVEVGGTVGDYENGFYLEALRELAFEEGEESVCFVALTYVIKPQTLGEQKSKAAQLGIKRLMEAGIQPHIIACRAVEPVAESVRQKIAMFSNVPMRRVFSMHDRPSVYTIPEDMRQAGLDREILSMLSLHDRVDTGGEDKNRKDWLSFTDRLTSAKPRTVKIGIAGKYISMKDAYASIDKTIEHCSAHLGAHVDLEWIETTDLTAASVAGVLSGLDGVIVPGGFGKRGVEGKIAVVQHCREHLVPFLGICLGFQVAVIEFARNVLKLPGANSTEFDPKCQNPVISELPEQKRVEGLGGTMRLGGQEVEIKAGSMAEFLFKGRIRHAGGKMLVRERFRHRFEVDPRFIPKLEAGGLVFSGRHPKQPIMQVLELHRPEDVAPGTPSHPYFVAGQFHPELTSRPLHPQPMFMGMVAACIQRRFGRSGQGGAGARDRSDNAAQTDAAADRWTQAARRSVQPV